MSTRLHAVLLVLLFCTAGFFATYHLKESPPVWYDEGFYVQSAANLATYGHMGLRITPTNIEQWGLITVGYPLIYPLAGWLKIFGISILSARTFMVLCILGLLLASYLFVKRLYGSSSALLALALLATLPTLYGNGKSVLGEVPGLLYLTLFLLSFHSAVSGTTRKYLLLLLAGLFAGLCVATKPTFLVLIPAILVGVCIEWRRSTVNSKEILVAAGASLLPMVMWILLQFQGGDSLASILSYYANPYEITNLFALILQNILNLFTSVGPLYLIGVMSVWTCALWIRMRKKEMLPTTEVITFVFSLLIIAAYTRTAGWYRYLFEAQALSLLFLPNALSVVAQNFVRFFNPRTAVVAAVSVLTLLGAYQVQFYSFVAESYGGHKTNFLEKHFATSSPSTSFFLYNVPEVAIFMHTPNYYQFIAPAGGSIGQEQLSVIAEGKVDEVIIGTDMYSAMTKDYFPLYKIALITHEYTFLKKKRDFPSVPL